MKAQSQHHGPYRVIDAFNDLIYRVRHLVTSNLVTVHAVRLELRCDELLI
jgi:hypothetical protein